MNFNTINLADDLTEVTGLAVVIDVLRAFTSSCFILHNGAKCIYPVSDLDHAFKLKKENPDYNVLYPYCKWTNQPDYVEFNIELPSSFMLSNVLTIIELFGDVNDNTDDYRIVFWFDN